VSKKNVLIIGTEVATNGLESGGSLRINGIKELLEGLDFNVSVVSRVKAKKSLKNEWDLVVLVSFATAKFLRRARKNSSTIWFDPTDSWSFTRYSLIRGGDLRHIPILLRDLFWVWTAPRIDLLTFITRWDAENEKTWWSKRLTPLIFPINNLQRIVRPSTETRLVFVGDGKYGPNVRAINFLSKVLDFLPVTYKIHIYGRGFESSNQRLILHGYCGNEEMYFENDIHLAPIELGAGLKLKVAVPLANGLMVISTPEGANGFSGNPSLLVAASEKSFAQQIIELTKIPNSSKRRIQSKIHLDDETSQILDWIVSNS